MRPNAGGTQDLGDTQMKKQMIIALAAVAAMASGSAMAFEKGDWTFKAGVTSVDPKQNNSGVDGLDIDVSEDSSVSLLGSYFFTPALSLELLASLPFEHAYVVSNEEGALGGGSTKHLPPTLSLQYHFNSGGTIIPYVGVGVNYTIFFSQKSSFDSSVPGLDGASTKLENSAGYALQAGLDYMFTENLFMNVDLRYIDIEPDLKLNGTKVGTVKINPTLVGLNVGYRF
jgi:outer membrane protein